MKHCRSCVLVDGQKHPGCEPSHCKRSLRPDGDNVACDHRVPKDKGEYKGLSG